MTKEQFIDLVESRIVELKGGISSKLVKSGIRTTQKDLETVRDFLISHVAETQCALEIFRRDLNALKKKLVDEKEEKKNG